MKIINPLKFKDKMESKEGVVRLKVLEDLNFKVQELKYQLDVANARYTKANLEFRIWLGYDVSEDEVSTLRDVTEALDSLS